MLGPEGENEMQGKIVTKFFDFSPEAYERLCEMSNETEVRDGAGVIRNALRFYDWFLNEQIQGNRVELDLAKESNFKRVEKRTAVYRVPLDFSPPAWMQFNDIRRKAEATSNAALLRDALHAYDQYLDQSLPGNLIRVVTKEGDTKEVEISFLSKNPPYLT